MITHRNSQKRICLENAVYFITTRTKDGYPYFANSMLSELFLKEVSVIQKKKKFRLYGYVVIPNHVHLLIQPAGEDNISKIMFSIKKHFAHEANRILGYNTKISPPKCAGGQTFARLLGFVDFCKRKENVFLGRPLSTTILLETKKILRRISNIFATTR